MVIGPVPKPEDDPPLPEEEPDEEAPEEREEPALEGDEV